MLATEALNLVEENQNNLNQNMHVSQMFNVKSSVAS